MASRLWKLPWFPARVSPASLGTDCSHRVFPQCPGAIYSEAGITRLSKVVPMVWKLIVNLHSETLEEHNDIFLLFLDITDSFKVDFTGAKFTCPLGTILDHSTYLNRVFKPCNYWFFPFDCNTPCRSCICGIQIQRQAFEARDTAQSRL